MTAPDPAWVEAGARASALWHRGEAIRDSDDLALAELVIAAVEPLIRADVLADLRAKVEGLPRETRWLPDGSLDDDWLLDPSAVLALIEEAGR